MTDLDRSMLRDIFVSSYESLRINLTRRLGCEALARETLHDTYIRLHRPGDIRVLAPHAYLLRMALNVAADNRRSQAHLTHGAELDAVVLDIRDDTADLVRAVAARQDLEKLEKALSELTPRRRRILLAARLQGLTLMQIAARLGISQRLVEMELKVAVAHCAQRLGRKVIQRFGPQPGSLAKLAARGAPALAQ